MSIGSVEVSPDGVFTTEGPMQWSDEESNVVLFYGGVGDEPSTYLEHTMPMASRRSR